jgi:uncharacterized protein
LKLHADPLTALNTVTAYGPGFIDINQTRHHGHLLVCPDRPVSAWDVGGFASLRREDFEAVAELAPEVVLLGTGERQRFVAPSLMAPLARRGVGVECMTTAAACRTYNILMAEGRRVVAAFLQET